MYNGKRNGQDGGCIDLGHGNTVYRFTFGKLQGNPSLRIRKLVLQHKSARNTCVRRLRRFDDGGVLFNLAADEKEAWNINEMHTVFGMPAGATSLGRLEEGTRRTRNVVRSSTRKVELVRVHEMQINYLVLRALYKKYAEESPYEVRAQEIYQQLRKNVIDNVFKEYERTGYVWVGIAESSFHRLDVACDFKRVYVHAPGSASDAMLDPGPEADTVHMFRMQERVRARGIRK
ncbi:hypothetical protein B0H14DRAFT_2656609 [Mycena olivaceomarginata]|nr:hypothetical protein B0H14DRAFT_2656609 [Mycena olivaceomarginata]